jgi:hypothetical protein
VSPPSGKQRQEASDTESREREAAEVEAQQQAAESREAYPDDAEGPPPEVEKGGETAYLTERMIADSHQFLGVPSHVAAGALAEVTDAYITVKDAKRLVENWLGESGAQARMSAAREEQ